MCLDGVTTDVTYFLAPVTYRILEKKWQLLLGSSYKIYTVQMRPVQFTISIGSYIDVIYGFGYEVPYP